MACHLVIDSDNHLELLIQILLVFDLRGDPDVLPSLLGLLTGVLEIQPGPSEQLASYVSVVQDVVGVRCVGRKRSRVDRLARIREDDVIPLRLCGPLQGIIKRHRPIL